MNNGEGNIFKILPHPKKHAESLPYFTTPHQTSVAKFCDLYGLKHYKANSLETLDNQFPTFIKQNEKPSVLEIDTSGINNDEILMDYFSFLKEYNDN